MNPLTLSTIAASVVSSWGEAITIGTIVVEGAEVIYDAVQKLKPYVASLMQTFEDAYASVKTTLAANTTTGPDKLKGVLAALQAAAAAVGVTWSTGLEAALTALISHIKTVYNAIVDAFAGTFSGAG